MLLDIFEEKTKRKREKEKKTLSHADLPMIVYKHDSIMQYYYYKCKYKATLNTHPCYLLLVFSLLFLYFLSFILLCCHELESIVREMN